MDICLITGSAGLIGSESVAFFASKFDLIIGLDNNMREEFFGQDASTLWNKNRLEQTYENYKHYSVDIRDREIIDRIFNEFSQDIKLVIHTAAQPSHDWAAKDPIKDFTVNANGTLVLLEATKKYSHDAVFIFTSTNKVYGDLPNSLPLVELETRWEISKEHPFYEYGINETMSIDQSKHSLFGASKVAADVLVQEYGRYFGMKTAVFRGGCLTGPQHSGTQLHGFLSYLMKCAVVGTPYTIFGYKGKQVRDNIHSYDLVNMFWQFYKNPRIAEVYNAGGSRHSNCSMTEAIHLCEFISGKKMKYQYSQENRMGDHIWYISDISKFRLHYPEWEYAYTIEQILEQIFNSIVQRHCESK